MTGRAIFTKDHAHSARYLIQRILNPRFLSRMVSYDRASDGYQALGGGGRGRGAGDVRGGVRGRAVQVDPIKPMLKAPWIYAVETKI